MGIKVQISFPFSSSLKLTEDQQRKLLFCQGRRLKIDDSELLEVTKVCHQKGWMNNGLAMIYEYAGSIDAIGDCANKLLTILIELELRFAERDLIVINTTMINFSMVLLRLVYNVFKWRNLQATPRPIYVHDGLAVLSLVDFLDDIGNRIITLIRSHEAHKSLWQLVSNEMIISIFSISKEFKSIQEVSRYFHFIDESENVQSRQYNLFFALKEFLDTEERIANLWKSMKGEYSKLSVLRFPCFQTNTEFHEASGAPSFSWFTTRQQHYDAILEFFTSVTTYCEYELSNNDEYAIIRHVLPLTIANPSLSDILFWENNKIASAIISIVAVSPVILQVSLNPKPYPESPVANGSQNDVQLYSPTTPIRERDLRQFIPPNESQYDVRAARASSATFENDSVDDRSLATPQRGRFYSADHLSLSSNANSLRKKKGGMASAVHAMMSPYIASNQRVGAVNSVDIHPSLLIAMFSNIDSRNWSKEWTAAGKIVVWFRLMSPRQKLLRRLYGRRCIQEVLTDVIDNVTKICRIRRKRKMDLLRQGAAVKIQRVFKNWYYVTREERKEIEMRKRMDRTIYFLSKWKYAVLTAIRLWKIIRAKFQSRAVSTNQPKLVKVLQSYMVLISLKEKAYGQGSRASEKLQKFRALEMAISVIQKLIKAYVRRKRIEKSRMYSNMSTKIALFMIKCLAKRRVRQKRRIFESATKIQKFLRGVTIRREMYKIVSSGLRLNACCRKYIAYKSLKSQLRRVDRPLTIQLRGLRNLPERLVNTGTVRIKISVWWNPLLHIVGHNDFQAILQSKRPQFVFESTTFKAIQEDNSLPSTDSSLKAPPSPQNNKELNSAVNQRKPRASLLNQVNGSSNSLPPILPAPTGRQRSIGLSSIQEAEKPKRNISIYSELSNDSNVEEEAEEDDNEGHSEHSSNAKGKVSGEASSSTEKSGSPNKFSVVRGTLNFAKRLGNAVQHRQQALSSSGGPITIKYHCNFEDLIIKIPGCHGNSVIKFEFSDADRKIGNCLFYLGKESGMMYWGGEYQREVDVIQQKRAIQFNSNLVTKSNGKNPESPFLDFRLIAGVPLRSKCQWARIIVRGSGPLKRTLQSQDIMSNLTLFDNWRRFYLSLDEFGLFLFENKFNHRPFTAIPVSDFKQASVDNSAPVRASKNVVEDITSVVLETIHGDEIFMRFPDASSRIAWLEVFTNAVDNNKKSTTSIKQKGWLSRSLGEFTNAFRKLNTRSEVNDDEEEEEDDDEGPVLLPSQILRTRKTIFGSSHNIF